MSIVLVKQSEATATRRRVPLMLVDSTDGITAETGVTGTARLSKVGGATPTTTAASTNSITEMDATNMPGRYYLELTAAEVDTLGVVEVYFKTAATAVAVARVQVVAYDPYDAAGLGLSRVDAAVSTRSSHTAADAATSVWGAATKEITGGTVGTVSNAVTVGTNNDKTGYSLTTLESAVLHSGTAAGGAVGSITLAAGASATNDLYNLAVVKIYGGTGAGQARVITDYDGTGKVATVTPNWTTAPDATSTYAVLALALPKTDASAQVTAASVQGNVTGSVASVTGSVGSVAAGGIANTSFGAGALDAAALASDAANEIADAMLDRNLATGTDSGSATVRTVRQALRVLRNKVGIASGTLTVYKEDDATSSWSGSVTTAAGDNISTIDPA